MELDNRKKGKYRGQEFDRSNPASCDPRSDQEDRLKWTPTTSKVITVASAVKALRSANGTVDWSRLLWERIIFLDSILFCGCYAKKD